VSLVITSLLVAGGVLAGRFFMKTARGKAPATDDDDDDASPTDERDAPSTTDKTDKTDGPVPRDPKTRVQRGAVTDLYESLPCRLGDVVIRAGGDEAWLAGALVFSEDAVVAAMYVAPEAGKDRGVYVRSRPAEALTWMEPLAAGEIVTGQEPPTSVEHDGVRFERTRRLPVRVERAGTGAPDVGDRAILAEYSAAGGERLVIVVGASPARAWRGFLLEPGMYDVLPGGKTLE
jgi:hypothetical protein